MNLWSILTGSSILSKSFIWDVYLSICEDYFIHGVNKNSVAAESNSSQQNCWWELFSAMVYGTYHHRNLISLQQRHNEHDGVSNDQPHDCLLNRLFRRISKKTSKIRVTGLCEGNSPHKGPVTREMFPFDDVIILFEMFVRVANQQQPSLISQEWWHPWAFADHYCDVIMGAMASQITSLTIVNSTVHSGVNQRKHQSSASPVFVRGIHSPHKWSVTRKMFPFVDVIM